MRPTVLLLYGFPGTGKLTVARALRDVLLEMGEEVRVVDNHWIANPIFGLVHQDGRSPLPEAVWQRVGEVADAVFATLEHITPPAWHLVFTAVLDGVRDAGFDDRVRRLAEARHATFVPVRLHCALDENLRRIAVPERRQRMKSVDPEDVRRLAAAPPRVVAHTNAIELDVTEMAPAEAAARIVDLARSAN